MKTPDKLKERLDEAWAGVIEFSNGLRHPLLRRLQYEIEQDIWIQWISELKGKPGQPQPMGPWGQMGNIRGPFGDPRVSDALDEDAVEERLERIGVIGEDSILGVDFGWNTTPADTEEAFDAAAKEQRRREQRGRLGVAVTPIGEKETGVVHLRDDAYHAAGRKNPSPGADGYFKAVAWVSGAAKGQVVRVEGSSKGKLEVQPVSDAKPLPVFGYEETTPRRPSSRLSERARASARASSRSLSRASPVVETSARYPPAAPPPPAEPAPGVRRRLGDWADRQARLDGALDADVEDVARVLVGRRGDRQLGPERDAGLAQELLGDPRQLRLAARGRGARRQELAHRERAGRRDEVVGARSAAPRRRPGSSAPGRPRRSAGWGLSGAARRDRLAALGDARQPVRAAARCSRTRRGSARAARARRVPAGRAPRRARSPP